MLNILLTRNDGFAWFQHVNIRFKGYAYGGDGSLLLPEKCLSLFESLDSFNDFERLLSSLNGIFSVVVQRENEIWLACDVCRMFPLFYSRQAGNMLIADDPDFFLPHTRVTARKEIFSEFLSCGFVPGDKTLLEEVLQVRAGECVRLSLQDPPEKRYYFRYLAFQQNTVKDVLLWAKKTETVLQETADRLIRSLQGRTAVVALSGGYDSRWIVAALKLAGYPHVVCFTYGRHNSSEARLAKKVAGITGYPWHFVGYTKELIDHYLDDPLFHRYYRYAASYVSMFYMTEYFAVKWLKDNHLIPSGAVFVSGQCGDWLGGSQLRKYLTHTFAFLQSLPSVMKDSTFLYARLPSAQGKKAVAAFIKECPQGALPYSIFEDWLMKEKLSKFVTNSVCVFNFFGYEHRLPFWDKELITFFRDLPVKYKTHEVLYNKVLKEKFFAPLGLNFPDELEVSPWQVSLQWLKNKLKPLFPYPVIRKTMKKHDDVFYDEITGEMLRQLASENIPYDAHPYWYNANIIHWYLSRIRKEALFQIYSSLK